MLREFCLYAVLIAFGGLGYWLGDLAHRRLPVKGTTWVISIILFGVYSILDLGVLPMGKWAILPQAIIGPLAIGWFVSLFVEVRRRK